MDPESDDIPDRTTDAGTVVDPAVLAERRVNRAELAEQAHAQCAAEAEEALAVAEAELHRSELRLERANDDRARLEARLGMREQELRTARHRIDAERRQRTEDAGGSGVEPHETEAAHEGALRGRLAAAEARVGELEAVRDEARKRQAQQGVLSQRLRELATAAAELRAQVAVLEAQRRSAEAAARRSDDALASLEAEHAGLREETERGAEAVLEAHRRLVEAQTTAQRARDDLVRERAGAETRIAQLSRSSEERLARSTAEAADLRARLEAETAELRARLEAETAELRARLEAETVDLQKRLEAERRARVADAERLADARAAGVVAAAEVTQARVELEIEVEGRLALEGRLGDEVSSLREELDEMRERARLRDQEAQRIVAELVSTAGRALSDAEEHIAQAETTVAALREEAHRERESRERAEADIATAREEMLRTEERMRAQAELDAERRRRSEGLLATLGIELAGERERAREREAAAPVRRSSEVLAAERAAEERMATTRRPGPGPTLQESQVMRAAAQFEPDGAKHAVVGETLRLDGGAGPDTPAPDQAASAEAPAGAGKGSPTATSAAEPLSPVVASETSGAETGGSIGDASREEEVPAQPDLRVEAGPGWLVRAIEAIAILDPETAADLLVSVLPLQSEVVERNLDYDIHLEPGGWWRAIAVPGLVRPLMALPAPRQARESDLRLEVEPAALIRLIAGAKRRRARRHGRMETKGSRRAAKAAVRSLTGLELDLGLAARESLWIEPRLVYLALARTIAPAWTAEHRFVVAHEIVGEHEGTWYVHVDGRSPIRVAVEPAEPPAATVRCSAHAFLPLLTSQPAPKGEKAALRGDLGAISALREWIARAQSGA